MTNKISFGDATAIACTLAALADGASRQSDAIDFTSTRYLDLLLELSVTTADAAMGSNARVEVYLARSIDGSAWNGGASGSDAAYSADQLQNLQHLGTLYTPTQDTAYVGVFDTVAGPNAALGLPPYVAVIIVNHTGQALESGALRYRGQQVASE